MATQAINTIPYIEQTDVNKGKFFSVKSECYLHRVRRYFRTLTVAVELYFHPFMFSFPFWPFFSTLRPPALANSWLTASSCTVEERRLQLPQYLLQVLLFSWEICRGFNLPCLLHPAPRRPKNKGFKIKFRSVNFLCCIIALQYKTNNKRSTVFGEVFSYWFMIKVVFVKIITQDKSQSIVKIQSYLLMSYC